MKMASRLIAPGVVPAGAGSARTASPMPTVAASAPGFAERRGATAPAPSFAATRVLRFTSEGAEARCGTAAAVGARQADIATSTSVAFIPAMGYGAGLTSKDLDWGVFYSGVDPRVLRYKDKMKPNNLILSYLRYKGYLT
jgi:hypothetical protein